METKLLPSGDEAFALAGTLIKEGELVGFPTETVYGLAANALSDEAVKKIFIAKGRPQDNPLIVHIAELSEMEALVVDPPALTYKLAEKFWPGPLTMVLPKSEKLGPVVTAGLDTVGIRLPGNPDARRLIRESGCPIAAPSGNLSGLPSPTKAQHMLRDMNGRIPLIIDGGECSVGLESTVIFVKEDSVKLLRPGDVTVEMLSTVCPVEVDHGVLHPVADGEKAASPGMKHTHYSPKAKIIIIDSDFEAFKAYLEEQKDDGVFAMVFDGEEKKLTVPSISFGHIDDLHEQAHKLFDDLRYCDELGAKVVYVRKPREDGLGLAIYNRLIRAAGFTVIKL